MTLIRVILFTLRLYCSETLLLCRYSSFYYLKKKDLNLLDNYLYKIDLILKCISLCEDYTLYVPL